MLFYLFSGRNARWTCRQFGISRQTIYRWKRRFDRHDLTTLEERSHRPHRVRTISPVPVEPAGGCHYAAFTSTRVVTAFASFGRLISRSPCLREAVALELSTSAGKSTTRLSWLQHCS
ncbi:MAG: helix-turn-helix domain-containing protein [Candidatus Acidiferrales bacterium]